MDKRLAAVGFTALLLLVAVFSSLRGGGALTGQAVGGSSSSGPEAMDACGRNDELFPLEFPDTGTGALNVVEAWSAYYHSTIPMVLAKHAEPDPADLLCTDDPRYEASVELKDIALKMEPWKSGAPLTERDMPAVLLSFLRSYECALEERKQDILVYVAADAIDDDSHFEIDPDEGGQDNDDGVSITSVLTEAEEEYTLIAREQQESRPALARTLQYFSGIDRLRPLQENLECLERVSLEIRNILSLTAEAASCLPKIWGSRDPQRDQ